jgi:regulator of protease activity HflC (stomatin/prohibitin superfamily)
MTTSITLSLIALSSLMPATSPYEGKPMNPLVVLRQYKIAIATMLFVLLFLGVYLIPSMLVYIYPGQAGLLFHAISKVPLPERIYQEGAYLIAPWNKMYIYDMTKQKRTVEIDALSNNGLIMTLRVSVIFHPDAKYLKNLLLHIGADYTDKVIIPNIHSAVRQVIGDYTPEALYTTARKTLHAKIVAEVSREFSGLPFLVEDVVVEKLTMPESINNAIENKLKAQQDALAYPYLLAKQQDEAKRQKIEATGIDEYQTIVGANLSPELLKWLEIRTLHDLSLSQNSKVIVLGGQAPSLPLVLDAAKEQ